MINIPYADDLHNAELRHAEEVLNEYFPEGAALVTIRTGQEAIDHMKEIEKKHPIYKVPQVTNCKRPFSDWWERLRGRNPDQWMIDASESLQAVDE